MDQHTLEKIALSDSIQMLGHYGPSDEQSTSVQMQTFESKLADEDMYIPVTPSNVYAALCGDGRTNGDGTRDTRGYFAFGGSYMPVLGEALANPEYVIEKGLRLDTHARMRFQRQHAAHPDQVFMWHTAEGVAHDDIGCGLLAGRKTVIERIANGEVASFVETAVRLGMISNADGLATRYQANARTLLDAGYLDVSNAALRAVPEDVKDLYVEEILVGSHNEWGLLVNRTPMTRFQSFQMPRVVNGVQVFVTDAWGLAQEAQAWARAGASELRAASIEALAVQHLVAMSLITVSGIATLANPNLSAYLR